MDLITARRRIMLNQKKEEEIIYEAKNLSFDASKEQYLNTGVYLFTEENINKDFEIIIKGLCGVSYGTSPNTILCAKYNSSAYGFLIRCTGEAHQRYAGTVYIASAPFMNNITFKRINGVISIEGEKITNQTETSPIPFKNMVHPHPLVLGCALQDDGTPYRYASGTIDQIIVKWI